MTEAEFTALRAFLKRSSGLDLGPEKRYLVESRLGPVCRASGLPGLSGVVQRLLAGSDPDLAGAVVDAMTTNETMFFRDRAFFEALRQDLLPALMARRPSRRLRIWSAAASTGQEAYSVAMLLDEMRPRREGWTVEILGSDVSQRAIERARDGIFTQFEVQRGLPIRLLMRHFRETSRGWRISAAMREAVQFRPFNLLGDPEAFGTFDLVLCRNVLIYMDVATKGCILDRLARIVAPDGALCLGSTESVVGLSRVFTPHPGQRNVAVPALPPARIGAAA